MTNLGEDGFKQQGENDSDNIKLLEWKSMNRRTVDEVCIDNEGKIHRLQRLSGDQTHQGRHVRISVGEYKILHVKLYEYN